MIVDVSADLVSRVTEDLENDLETWQARRLQFRSTRSCSSTASSSTLAVMMPASVPTAFITLGIKFWNSGRSFSALDSQRGGKVLAEF